MVVLHKQYNVRAESEEIGSKTTPLPSSTSSAQLVGLSVHFPLRLCQLIGMIFTSLGWGSCKEYVNANDQAEQMKRNNESDRSERHEMIG